VGTSKKIAIRTLRPEKKDAIDWLLTIPARNSSRPFLIDGLKERVFSFNEIHEQASAIANWLLDNKLSKGNRIAVVADNDSMVARLYFGALYAGVVVVPINPILTSEEIDFIIKDSEAKMVVATALVTDRINGEELIKRNVCPVLLEEKQGESVFNAWKSLALSDLKTPAHFKPLRDVTETDDLLIVYTSGTTAEPKGMVHRIADLVNNGRLFGNLVGITKKNRFFNNLAITYLGGYYNLLLLPYVCESSVVLSETFSPNSVIGFWKPIIKYQANTLWLVASIMAILLEMDRGTGGEKYCRQNVLHILAGMAPLPAVIRQKFEERYGQPVYENYGLSETLFISTNRPKFPIRDGCVGKIVPGVEVAIKNHEDKDVKPGEEGEIWVKTFSLMRGYVDDVKRKQELSTKDWFATGDLGVLNNGGDLFITGRKKDLIIRGGINISPAGIENVLHQHPAVMECAVVGVPHKFLGEEVVAVVRLAEGSEFTNVCTELMTLCQKHLARIKAPSQIIELLEFPHTTSGKIQKRKIRTWLMQKGDGILTTPLPTVSKVVPAGEVHFTPSKIVSESIEAMSIKYNTMVYEMQQAGKDVIVLSLGEAFFDIPLYDFSALPFPKLYHYSHSRGIPELRDIMAKYFLNEYDVAFNPTSEIIITAGSKIAIHMAIMSILNPGDEVMYYEPAWVSYPEQIKLCYGVPVSIPYDEKITNFEKYVTNRTRMLIINNPNNPTGRVFNLNELGCLYSLARKYNLFILSDEAYSDFVLDGSEFISLANLDIEKRHTIIVNSLSKNFGMSGWRLGYVITNPGLINQILKVNQHLITCPPTILEYYSVKYFDQIIKTTKPQIVDMVRKRQQIQKFMEELGLKPLAGTATFYFFVSIEPSKLSSEEFSSRLLENDHVCVVPGIGYGKSCDRFVRVSVGSENVDRIKKALRMMKKMIEETSK